MIGKRKTKNFFKAIGKFLAYITAVVIGNSIYAMIQ